MRRILVVIYLLVLLAPAVESQCTRQESYQFSRHHNKALSGHVIKSLAADYISCTEACAETLECMSFNLYTNSDGTRLCELNKSSQSASPDSLVDIIGNEYDEKEFLPVDGWYRFNSSLLKLFKVRLTWGGASTFCRSLGANLTSITSEVENTFLKQVIIPDVPRGNSSDQLIASWRLDGTDPDITLHGAAAFQTVDGHKALYLNGQTGNYATTPALDITTKSFLIGAWINILTPAPAKGIIYADWSYPYKFDLYVLPDTSGGINACFVVFGIKQTSSHNLLPNNYYSSIKVNKWVHVAVTWDRSTREGKIYVNGQQRHSMVSPYQGSDIDLKITGHTVYDIGLKRDTASGMFHGYIRDLTVFKLVSQYDVKTRIDKRDKFDGVWIGLNDVKTEGILTNSDSSPVTFTDFAPENPNSIDEDCSSIDVSDVSKTWTVETCGKELPFICKKPAE